MAQFNLGILYDDGHGVPQDHAQASTWLRKAADQGDADAQGALEVIRKTESRPVSSSERPFPNLTEDQKKRIAEAVKTTLPDLKLPISDEASSGDQSSES
jgi:TPR repeat protein